MRPPLSIHEAFSALRAEAEPWLPMVYVPPASPTASSLSQSAVILGKRGSGKSAYLSWLTQTAEQQGYLPLRWEWDPLSWVDEAQAILDVEKALVVHLLADLARLTFIRIRLEGDTWDKLTATAKNWLQNFWRKYLAERSDWLVALPVAQQDEALAFLEACRASPPLSWVTSLTPLAELGYLIPLVRQAGFQGIVVLLEDPLPAMALETRLEALLCDFLAFLALFDVQGIIFKLALDDSLSTLIAQSPVVERRRATVLRLQWSEAALETIVSQRLRLTMGESFTLSHIYKPEVLRRWLNWVGGVTPRGWLEAMAAFMSEFLTARAGQTLLSPLTETEWRDIGRRLSPQPTYGAETGILTIGWHTIPLPPGEQALFECLWKKQGKLCSREELFKAYSIKVYGQKTDQAPAEYRGLLDTALYRLRMLIEPDPDAPLWLTTQRGKGVVLDIPL